MPFVNSLDGASKDDIVHLADHLHETGDDDVKDWLFVATRSNKSVVISHAVLGVIKHILMRR